MKRKSLSLPFAQCSLRFAFPLRRSIREKFFRIGYLDVTTASGSAVLVDALRQELSKLGWVEGKNIAFEYRFAEQKQERLVQACGGASLILMLLSSWLLVAGQRRPAKNASSAIPIVVTAAQDARSFRIGC